MHDESVNSYPEYTLVTLPNPASCLIISIHRYPSASYSCRT
jgi:hypothetical protein